MALTGMAVESATGSDKQLVAAVRRGDDRAFEELYARYQRRIAAYVYGMVNDHGRAEDLTQEIFMSALRRMRQTDRPIAFRPWVYEIAKNACIDQFRRACRTEEISFDADEGAGGIEAARFGHAAPGPDAAVDAKQQLADLCRAFGGLSASHHRILVLRELEGLSYREIGSRLGLTRASVESTLFRARRRLTEEYDELVSGERCRRVQAMLVSGASARGARDQRRLARHIAHCQPCRLQARLATADRALPPARRAALAGRVAALVPVPVFLRLRRPPAVLTDSHSALAQWSGSVSTIGEPAVSWGKALAAAVAMLVAGGTGVVVHDTPAPPARVAPQRVAAVHRAVGAPRTPPPAPVGAPRPAPRHAHVPPAPPARAHRARHKRAVRRAAPSGAPPRSGSSLPITAAPAPAPSTGPPPPPHPRGTGGTTSGLVRTPDPPAVNNLRLPPINQFEKLATTANGQVGRGLGDAQALVGSLTADG